MEKKKKKNKFVLFDKEYKFVKFTKEESEELRKKYDKPYYKKLPKPFTLRKVLAILNKAKKDKRANVEVIEALHWATWVIKTLSQNRDMSVELTIGTLRGIREAMAGKMYKMVEVQKKGE